MKERIQGKRGGGRHVGDLFEARSSLPPRGYRRDCLMTGIATRYRQLTSQGRVTVKRLGECRDRHRQWYGDKKASKHDTQHTITRGGIDDSIHKCSHYDARLKQVKSNYFDQIWLTIFLCAPAAT